MRASVLLLVAVLTLLVVRIDATSTTNELQETRTEAVDGNDRGFNSKRLLREESSAVATDEEERAAITDFLKKSTSGATKWLKDKTLVAKLKFKALPMNLDKPVQRLMEKGIDPDRVFTLLNLHKTGNREINGFLSNDYMLWEKLTAAWTKKIPELGQQSPVELGPEFDSKRRNQRSAYSTAQQRLLLSAPVMALTSINQAYRAPKNVLCAV